MSFLNLPINRPAALVRLPPRVSQVATTPSAGTDDERASELSSSGGATLTASVSTLASRATTAETADTEISAVPNAEQLKAEEKKKRKAALAKEKRKRRKAKLAAEKVHGAVSTEKDEESDNSEDEEEADPRVALAEKFRRASVDSNSALEKHSPIVAAVALPQASSSKSAAPTTDWASMTAEDEETAAQFISIPTGPRAQLNRFSSDPSITPRLGKFWGHDERNQDRKGKQPLLHPLHSPAPPSSNGSRRGSMTADQLERSASPALSTGSGWQKVSRGGKRNAFGMPTNSTSSHHNYQEPSWKHDRFEENAPTQPKAWPVQSSSYGNFNNRGGDSDENPSRRPSPFYARIAESSTTARSPYPFLFNEPGSRTVIDDTTGKRKNTLRICLKPIPALLLPGSKREARQRANVVELSCFLHFDEDWPRPTAAPISDEAIFIIKLNPSMTALKLMTPAGELKKAQQAEEARLEQERTEAEAAALAEIKRVRDEELAQERGRERARVERELAEEESRRRSSSARGILYTTAPVHEAAPPMRSQSVAPQIQSHASTSRAPSAMEQHSPAPIHASQVQATAHSLHKLQQQFMSGPSAPVPHQPFIGQDGLPYIVDPATGHIFPYNHGGFPPQMPLYPQQPAPGYHFDPSMVVPTPSQSPPVSTHTPSFFAPPKSQRLEIRAPSAEDAEKPSHKKQHKAHLSSSTPARHSPLSHSISSHHQYSHDSEIPQQYHLNQTPYNTHQQHQQHMDEQYIPGSYFDSSGVMHFLPPNYNPYQPQPQPIYFPPPMYAPAPSGFQDPAILSMGNEMGQPQQQQQQYQEGSA